MTGSGVCAGLPLWYNGGQYIRPRGLARREQDGHRVKQHSPHLRGRFGVRR